MSALLLLAAEKKFWILDPLYAAFGTVLAWIYSVIPSYGVAIMLLTVAVSVLRMPLVKKQVKSQQEMQRIQPELKRIQAKYKNEPQKRNEEMMKLYKEHDVNPFAGCLPLFLQLPLMIVLYRVILGLGRVPPKHIPHSSDLFGALQAAGGKMESFGMDLAQSAARATGFGTRLPYFVLIALVVGTGLFQQRQMTARLPKDAQNSQMAVMGKIFPAFFGLISYSIPAGVVLYFFVSNVWQIGQQAVLFRKQDEEKAAGKGGKGGKAAKAAQPKVEELPPSDGAGASAGGATGSGGSGGDGAGKAGAGAGKLGGGAGKAGGGSGKKAGVAKGTKPARGKSGAAGARGAGGGGGKSAGGKPGSAKAPAARGGRGLFGGFGAGKAAGRNGGRSVRKTERRPTDGKDGSGPNGRTSSKGGTGRAQPKGTNPQGRPRKGK